MSVLEMAKLIGMRVLVKDGPVKYAAKIKDVKLSYGSPLFLICPVEGSGEKWVKDFEYSAVQNYQLAGV